ncbi:MAG: CpsD/CapB family tyrosine-protein kinase [Candidatus Omnitrophica bacterium]|nr:CpsD/CapB family tyrosine-protein kinase [Candidatus Omnitrophota bacterium]
MGKITRALMKAAEERFEHLEKVSKIKEHDQFVIRKMKDSVIDARIIAYFDPKSIISEQYKSLMTNLLSGNKSRPEKVISITSSIHAEGKTITALNLAITMSRAIHKPKILLIDADLRKGKMTRYLGIKQETGLSEVLRGTANLKDVLFNIDIEQLTFMASGAVPPNPAELLASDAMKDLISEVRSMFDYVLIDTPPVIPVTDAVILGGMTEGTLMVVQAGRTQRGMVDRATELLNQAQTKIIGHVLTGIEYFVPEYIYRYL